MKTEKEKNTNPSLLHLHSNPILLILAIEKALKETVLASQCRRV